MNKIKTLFLAANPEDTDRLALDEEIREITSKIRAAEYHDSIELISAWAVRPDDLLQLLNQHKPQIVHFSGHGSYSGEIILTDNYGVSKPVSSKALKALFTTLKDNIKVVVLNACYSKEQAKTITGIIDCTVGMSDSIGDKAAITFAASFYRAIGFGRSIKESFDQGITALLLEGFPEENTPELLVKSGVDPSQIRVLSTVGLAKSTLGTTVEQPERKQKEISDLINKGAALLKQGKYEGAIRACDKTIQLDPKWALPWRNKGNALKRLGRTSEAKAAFVTRSLRIRWPLLNLFSVSF